MIQRFRVTLGFLIAAAVLYLATPTRASVLLGLPLALTGATFRALAAGVIKKDSRLATVGPYAWTRNPLYFGSTFLALGFGVMSWNVAAAALVILPSALIYPTVIRKEEAHLQNLFGEEFERYKATVPRFFPRFRSGRVSFSLPQYLANREYNTAVGFVAAFAIIARKLL